MFNEFNENITLRSLLAMTRNDNQYKTRFDNAKRDCKIFASDLVIKKVSAYSRFNIPRETFEIISMSYPNYPPYVKKKGDKQKDIKHSYPVSMSFFMPKGSPQRVSLNSPVKLRTGKGGKVPTRTKRMDKLIQSEENPNRKYACWSDYVAKEFEINLDFYYRNSELRAKRNCLFGKNYATKSTNLLKKKPSKSNRDDKKKKRSRKMLFLTKHEIAVIDYLIRAGFFGNDKAKMGGY